MVSFCFYIKSTILKNKKYLSAESLVKSSRFFIEESLFIDTQEMLVELDSLKWIELRRQTSQIRLNKGCNFTGHNEMQSRQDITQFYFEKRHFQTTIHQPQLEKNKQYINLSVSLVNSSRFFMEASLLMDTQDEEGNGRLSGNFSGSSATSILEAIPAVLYLA